MSAEERNGAAPSSRRRTNRFDKRDTIEWLSYEQRAQYRKTVAFLGDMYSVLDNEPDKITPAQEGLLRSLTDSDSHDTRIACAWDVYERTENAYLMKLAKMAPFELTAYHELMNPTEPPAKHHIWLCEHLQKVATGEIITLLLSMPAGTAKTTYASKTFAQWYMGNFPDRNILAVGNQQKFVEAAFSKPNRDSMLSERYNWAFPDVTVDPAQRGGPQWKLDGWRGTYYARGRGGAVLGIRAHLVLGDDLFGQAEDALSEVIRAAAWQWWTSDVGSRRLPNAPTILVNTRYHSEDPIGMTETLYNEKPHAVPGGMDGKVAILNIPAEAGPDDPLGREEGEWLWCRDQQDDGFYTIEDYETKRATMPAGLWSAVYLGKPLDKLGEYISEDQFKRYVRYPRNIPGRPMEWSKTVMSVDTAAKGNERSDNSAIMVFRVGVDKVHYLVETWAGKETLEKLVERMNKMMRYWECGYAIVEDSGMGTTLLENYQGKMARPLMKYVPSGKGSKEFRFDNAATYITTGICKFPDNGVKWVVPTLNEMIAFPNGTYDDRVDAFSMYFDYEVKNKRGGSKPLKMRG